MIPKDVVICDWHYERPDQTAVYFAWARATDMLKFREYATRGMKDRYYGMMQTVWSGSEDCMNGFYGRQVDEEASEETHWNTFRTMYEKINELDPAPEIKG